MTEKKELIITLTGSEPAVYEIMRHLDSLSSILRTDIHIGMQTTDDLKEENKAIHNQCFNEQKKRSAIFKYLYVHNKEIAQVISSWKDQDYEDIYNDKSPLLDVKK